jgi:hypothetical protein
MKYFVVIGLCLDLESPRVKSYEIKGLDKPVTLTSLVTK